MQITLVQSEIEEALRRYIGSQLTVSSGMQMIIDLRAGRGSDGFTATVDIKPGKQSEVPKAPVTQPNESSYTPGPLRAMPFQARQEETVSEQPKVDAAPEKEEAPFDGGTTVAPETHAASEAPEAPKVEEEEHPLPKTGTGGGRSLFRALAKPKN